MSNKCTLEELYCELEKFVYWLAHRHIRSNDPHVLLGFDDLAGDLFEELVKGWNHYQELPKDQLLKVVRTMLHNRLSELIYTYHKTYRKGDAFVLSLNHLADDSSDHGLQDINDGMTLETIERLIGNADRMDTFFYQLTDPELLIVDSILDESNMRMQQQVRLIGIRKSYAHTYSGRVWISPEIVADAMHLDRKATKEDWKGIRDKWKEVYIYGGVHLKDVTVQEVSKRTGKRLLLDLAEELGLSVPVSTHSYKVVGLIRKDLDDNGVPEDTSDDLFNLLVLMNYITENGDLIDEEENGGDSPEESTVTLPDRLPECWGWADPEEDPACKRRCKIQDKCVAQRKSNTAKMPCFGVLYNPNDDDCGICNVWKYCKAAMITHTALPGGKNGA